MSSPDPSDWKLCARPDCREANRRSLPSDRARIRLWLLSLRNDAAKMSAMRTLVPQRARPRRNTRDEAVIDWLANLGSRGQVHLHSAVAPVFPTFGSTATAEADPIPFPLAERGERAARETFHPSVIDDPPTFPAGVDLAQQGAALIAAAADGAPFCLI